MQKNKLNIPAVLIHDVNGVQYRVNGIITSINESNNTCSMKFRGYPVFNGIPMSSIYMNEAFLDKVKEYGKKAHNADGSFPENIHVHMFRHSLGTQLVRNGVPLPYISDLFGHAQLETTRIYAKNDPKDVSNAIEEANKDINKKLGKHKEGKKWANKEDKLLALCGLV